MAGLMEEIGWRGFLSRICLKPVFAAGVYAGSERGMGWVVAWLRRLLWPGDKGTAFLTAHC